MDENLQHGQIRRLQEDLVAANVRGMLENPPAVPLRLRVWQDPGVCAFVCVIVCVLVLVFLDFVF